MKFFLSFLFILCIQSLFSQSLQESIYALDIEARNEETSTGNSFSLNHALIVAGVPYILNTNFEDALTHKMIIITGEINENTFNQVEKEQLIAYVNQGGTLFATQLKDPALFQLFGVEDYKYATNHTVFRWIKENTGNAGSFLNDPNELVLKLGDTSLVNFYGTRSYSLTSASPLAEFENNTVSFCKNKFGEGHSYLLGINWRDIILRNQVMKHFKASRTYSNGYEPGSDVFYHFIRGIYTSIVPFASYKHTSVYDSESILVITHDVDATSAIKDIMTDFSSYEYENNIRASYFVTTHYMHDSVAKNFWDGYTQEIKSVLAKKHEVASHSVSHMPDFDNSGIVPLGECGHNEMNIYRPFYDGLKSNNVTVCGEVEVSKKLLDNQAGASVKSFRAGYLAYNKGIIEALEETGYEYNTSSSANNVLTAYPFQGHINLSMNARVSPIYEIPNTISDVFNSDRMSEENYLQKVAIWSDVQKRYAEDNAPSILLIHPNRTWKITAQQLFIQQLPSKTAIIPFEEYGNFWKQREKLTFTQSTSHDSIVTIKIASDSIPNSLSIIIKNGVNANKIIVLNKNNDSLRFLQSRWKENDIILHSLEFESNYKEFIYEENNDIRSIGLYPNPMSQQGNIQFELLKDAEILFELTDYTGRKTIQPINQHFELGKYSIPLNLNSLEHGMYQYRLWVNNELKKKGKMVIQ